MPIALVIGLLLGVNWILLGSNWRLRRQLAGEKDRVQAMIAMRGNRGSVSVTPNTVSIAPGIIWQITIDTGQVLKITSIKGAAELEVIQ